VPRVLLTFEPPDGGVAENVAQLALGVRAHGWEPEVAGPEDALPYPVLEAAGIHVHRLAFARGYGRPGRDLAALRGLAALLRDGRFALVHCHASKAGAVGRVAALASRTPSLYSPHCFSFAGDLTPAWRVASRTIERGLGATGGDVLCVCDDERRVALRARVAPPERLHVVHNGCAPCADGAEPDPVLSALRAGGPVVAAVAVLREQKRLDLLVDAVPLILARAPEARVAIVGDGPMRDALHARAARLGLDGEPRFAFLPFSPPVTRYLRALDVFVLPSAWEAFPIGVLEALACGVPQVVTDVGGSAEAVTASTGAVVAPGDPVALADAVAALVADPARRAAAADASRARHAERFGVERMVAGTTAVYATVAARAGG
jgi:glycosyltransferase involved in cell wall biosynthesis